MHSTNWPRVARFSQLLVFCVLASARVFAADPSSTPAAFPRPLIIGHRGAAGYLPEHTLEGYTLAIAQGADFIEPDLVSTKDGVLIARHENDLADTTDVAGKFPGRRTEKSIDGKVVRSWFSEDFTLAEIKTLRARERLPFRDHSHDGQYGIPTFDEILALAQRRTRETGRRIGVYPETKHPTYFRSIGLPLEEPLLARLEAAGWSGPDAPVFIQSFEVGNLKALAHKTHIPLIQLIGPGKYRPWDLQSRGDPRTYADLITPAGLAEIATYAKGIGPDKGMILPLAADKRLLPPTSLVADAHAAGLLVHPYTFRKEARFQATDFGGDLVAELQRYYALGVDGVFCDFPDVAAGARTHFLGK